MSQRPSILKTLQRAPVIPVLIIEELAHAVPLAKALVAGGLPVLEITLRSAVALDAIRAIKDALPEAITGAGTVLTDEQLDEVEEAGAAFAVSPGSTPRLLDAAERSPVPLLAGAATASEVMALLERGHQAMKLFPAEAVGGVALLKSLASPLPAARFCPTGGIDAKKAEAYLALPNVLCVGGSWVAPADAVASGDWARVTELARAAAVLPRRAVPAS